MYLSRMHLNPRRRGTRLLVGNPQTVHAAVMSSFHPTAHGEGRVLWRMDRDGDHLALYILSPTAPSFEHIQEQAGWSNQESWDVRPYGRVLDRITLGQEYSFRLVANPSRIVTGEDGKKRRFAHVTVDQQLGWLTDRASSLGVEFIDAGGVFDDEKRVPAVAVTSREISRFQRKGATVTVSRSQFDGAIRVTDVDALRNTLTNGVGKAKAYGCGLLTLAPLGRR